MHAFGRYFSRSAHVVKAVNIKIPGQSDEWAKMIFGNTQTEVEIRFIKIMLILVIEKEERGKKDVLVVGLRASPI